MKTLNVCCCLKYLYPTAEAGFDYEVTDAGSGQRITYWNNRIGIQPSIETMAGVEQAAILQDAQNQQIDVLRTACRAAIETGFVSDATGKARLYPMSPRDQMSLEAAIGKILRLATAKPTLPCAETSATGAVVYPMVEHNAAQVKSVHDAWNAWREAQRFQYRALLAKVQSATTPVDVRAVSWTNGA